MNTRYTEKIKKRNWEYAERLVDYVDRRTVGEVIDEPGLYEAVMNTKRSLKRYMENLKVECKDCSYKMLPEERREKMADGSVLCGDCLSVAEYNASADWDTREGARY